MPNMISSDADDEPECRICRGNAEPERPLFYPCKCSGSIKYTHEDCLVQWLRQSRSEECELCHHPFRFEPMYQPDTPQSLPFIELLSGIFTKAQGAARAAARISLVVLVWMFMLPLLTCWTWHSLFAGSVNQLPMMIYERGLFGVVGDILQGHLLSVIIIFIFFGVSSLREHIQHPNDGLAQDALDAPGEIDPVEGAEPALDNPRNEDQEGVQFELQHAAQDGTLNETQENVPAIPHEDLEPASSDDSIENATRGDDGENQRAIEESPQVPVVENESRDRILQGMRGEPAGSDSEDRHVNMNVESATDQVEDTETNRHNIEENVVQADAEQDVGPGAAGEEVQQDMGAAAENLGEGVNVVNEAINRMDDAVNNGRIENRERNGDGAPLFGLFDLDPEDVPLEEVVGLKGPIRNLFENSGTVLFSNVIFLCIFALFPLIIGRLALRFVSVPAWALYRPIIGTSDPTDIREKAKRRAASAVNIIVMTALRELIPMPGFITLLRAINIGILSPGLNLSLTFGANTTSTVFEKSTQGASQLMETGKADGDLIPGNFFIVLLGYGVLSVLFVSYVVLSSLLKSRYPRLDSPAVRYLFRFVRCVATFVKVVLLLLFEFGVFPLMCGWWLDICTLSFVGSTFESRSQFLRSAPWTSTLIHWLLGLIYMVNVSLFITLLRELLQPSLLWFLRNPEDPDFHPFRELIYKPLSRHARRMALSVFIYGPLIYLLAYVPCMLCLYFFPRIFPFNVRFMDPLTEVPADLFLLHISIPLTSLIRKVSPRKCIARLLRIWIRHVSKAFGIYKLVAREADATSDSEDDSNDTDGPQNVRARGFAMLVCAWATLVVAEMLFITIPTITGRMTCKALGLSCSHDIYTFGAGVYEIIFLVEGGLHILAFVRNHELVSALRVIRRCINAFLKISVVLSSCLVLLPLMTGLIVELTLIVPIRVGVDESVHWYMYQDWALGLLVMKAGMRLVTANERTFRARWNAIRNGGIAALDTEFLDILKTFVVPVFCTLGTFLSFPLIFTRSILPMIGIGEEWQWVAERYMYSITAGMLFQGVLCILTKKALVRLHDKIRDDKYLMGKRLYNFGSTENSAPTESNHPTSVKDKQE